MKNNDYKGREKREHFRIEYPESLSPKFNTRTQEFNVKNISEGGLGFVSNKKIKLKGWIEGKLSLQGGETLDIDGIVVRKKGDKIGLKFITPLPADVIRNERKTVVQKAGDIGENGV